MSQTTVLTEIFFANFDLHSLLRRGLEEAGFLRCTPIQALTLPVALSGRDVAGQAQTGTGKTCAFLVVLINRLLTRPAVAERKDADPRALVIAPTRELAIQIDQDIRHIGGHTGLRTALIYGGVDYDKQRQQLQNGCDVIIATPGRLLDYYKQRVFSLAGVEVMVIDEADRMFDLGFIKDVRYIFRRLPAREQRQVLLFSATLSHRVLELAYEHMHDAEKLVVESDNITADRVRQLVYYPAKEEKLPLLLNLIDRLGPSRSIVFVNTKAVAERLMERLACHGVRVGALSGDVPQIKRQKLLGRFQAGSLDMLVCTDVAARGLHIPAVSHVFNYDLPQDSEDYVHRIGRTARLGAEGDAISFACDLYAISLPEIESYIGQKIPTEAITPELLVMPSPRVPACPRDEVGDENELAVEDKAARQLHERGRRRGGGRSCGERVVGETRHSHGARPARPASQAATPATSATEAERPRRRRENGAVVATRPAHDEQIRGPRPTREERRPARAHIATTPTPMASGTALQQKHEKPGIIRRIVRFFTGR